MASLGIQPSLIKTKRPTFSYLDQTQVMVRLPPKRLTISFQNIIIIIIIFFGEESRKFHQEKRAKSIERVYNGWCDTVNLIFFQLQFD